MANGPRILLCDLDATAPVWALGEAQRRELLAQAPPGWEVRFTGTPAISNGDGGTPPTPAALAAMAAAEIYFGYGISPELFAAGARLRWVHSAAAGVGAVLFPALRDSDVLLTNSAGVHAEPIADSVLGGILFLLRDLEAARALQREAHWTRAPFVGEASRMRELADCRALVVGAGGIGTAVARRLAAAGVRCTAIRRRPALGAPPEFVAVHPPEMIPELAREADLLIISAPATDATAGLISAEVLDALPAAAIVCNVARGALVDERALAERVVSGRLRGAVLDVFCEEPLPSSSPLWALGSVVITPHVAGVSPAGFWRRELALFLDNWYRYAAGEPLRNLVDKSAGY